MQRAAAVLCVFFRLPDDRQTSAALSDLNPAVTDPEPAAAPPRHHAEKPAERIGAKLIAAVRKAGQADRTHRIIQIAVKSRDGNILRHADPLGFTTTFQFRILFRR